MDMTDYRDIFDNSKISNIFKKLYLNDDMFKDSLTFAKYKETGKFEDLSDFERIIMLARYDALFSVNYLESDDIYVNLIYICRMTYTYDKYLSEIAIMPDTIENLKNRIQHLSGLLESHIMDFHDILDAKIFQEYPNELKPDIDCAPIKFILTIFVIYFMILGFIILV